MVYFFHSLISAKMSTKLYTLGLIVIVKNEGMVIKEFIEHYKWQGVQHIYLIDNGCTDNTISIIQPYIDEGYVSCFEMLRHHAQTHHYTAVFNAHIKKECEWLIVCDADEYMYARTPNRSILDEIMVLDNTISCIHLNWRVFGSNGFKDQPASIRTSFVMCEDKLQKLGKSIVKCDVVDRLGIHCQRCNHGRTINNPASLSMNHYSIMSWEYFSNIKMTRGDAAFVHHDKTRNEQYFQRYDEAFGKHVHNELCNLVIASSSNQKQL